LTRFSAASRVSIEHLMSSQSRKLLKFGTAIAVILAALGYLAYTGVQESKSYYVTIKELRAMGDGAFSKRLRVAGNVQPGSIRRSGTNVSFVLVENDQLLSVVYRGTEPPPDTFKDNAQALAEGSFNRDGTFYAKQIQAKCASKYAPQENQAAPTKNITRLKNSPARVS
jgi:cytochrome c-type biogenesis protein CcmE